MAAEYSGNCQLLLGGTIRNCGCKTSDGWLECPKPVRDASKAAVAASLAQQPAVIGFEANLPQLSRSDQYTQSRAMGFTGDICSHCGSPNMTRNGTCVKCNDCGETDGCS